MMDLKLSGNWRLQWFEPGQRPPLEIASPSFVDDRFWMEARVPGDVHSALVEKRVIDDPFVGHNDLKCRWVEDKEWWYRTAFVLDEEPDGDETAELRFEGLDTFATVYLNGLEIGSAENMLVEHVFDVTGLLQRGQNVLAVRFDPVRLRVKDKEKNYWCGFEKDRIWTRKAAMNFGWDWGPRLVTAGIWKDVSLRTWRKARLFSVFPRTVSASEERAVVAVDAEVLRRMDGGGPLEVDVRLTGDGRTFTVKAVLAAAGRSASSGGPQDVGAGSGQTGAGTGHAGGGTGDAGIGDAGAGFGRTLQTCSVVLEVDRPRLWWTHDVGEPFLYRLDVTLKDADGGVLDRQTHLVGIRELVLETKHESGENLFCFRLNGVRLFAKGANWIPVHSFIGAAEDARYEKLLRLARDAGMNMLRVWGGGIYEKDVFYRECDRLGILVWQDFMFANALYPDYNRNFMDNVRDEVAKAIRRLRKHACLALWCGNNEIDWLYEKELAAGRANAPLYGKRIWHELIPSMLRQLDPIRHYQPSSPWGGNDHNSMEAGNHHNWQVWHGNVEPRKFGEPLVQDISVEGVSFKNYKKDTSRFSNEFGMHASANRHTLAKYIPEGEFRWQSGEMARRNKDIHHEKGLLLMEGCTGVPRDLDQYIRYSMLTQAEGLKYGVEHFRRRKPFTSGALIWQLNDCWPGTSWSLIDYELLPKASYYYARTFFAPVAATIDHDPGKPAAVWLVNDRREAVEDELLLEVKTFEGKTLRTEAMRIAAGPGEARRVAVFAEEDLLNGGRPESAVVRLRSRGGLFPDNVYYLRDFKDLALPKARLSVRRDAGGSAITVATDNLARFVMLDIPQGEVACSDNFFDLLPGESRTIELRHLSGEPIRIHDIRVSAVNGDERLD